MTTTERISACNQSMYAAMKRHDGRARDKWDARAWLVVAIHNGDQKEMRRLAHYAATLADPARSWPIASGYRKS